jgi:hypothetical protein
MAEKAPRFYYTDVKNMKRQDARLKFSFIAEGRPRKQTKNFKKNASWIGMTFLTH